jgi:dTDP-3-amino-3,4,6-trideoxy-alpha-D-glucose transaminase
VASPILLADPHRQYLELRNAIDDAISAVISRGVFTPDEQVDAFEAEFAAWIGLPHAVAVASGSAALTLALRALGVGPGDEVATTANLDISAVAPISQVGAQPLFVDIEPASHTMSPLDLERRLTTRTRAVVVVHAHGNPAAMSDLLAVAHAAGTPVIEDATLAPGARFGSHRVGALGTVGCFSLAPTKPLGAFGNAGVVVTESAGIAKRVRTLANYGFRADSVAAIRSGTPLATFHYEEAGINASMDELQAAVLRVKLPKIDEWSDRRRSHAATYRVTLADAAGPPVRQVEPVVGAQWAPRSFVIEHARRDDIARLVHERNVRSALNYVPPMHVQGPYGGPSQAGTLPVTERAAEQLLCLPAGPELRPEEVDYAAAALRDTIAQLT